MLDVIKSQYPLVLSTMISILIQLLDGIQCLCAWAPKAQTQTFHLISPGSVTDFRGTVVKHPPVWRRRDLFIKQFSPVQW